MYWAWRNREQKQRITAAKSEELRDVVEARAHHRDSREIDCFGWQIAGNPTYVSMNGEIVTVVFRSILKAASS